MTDMPWWERIILWFVRRRNRALQADCERHGHDWISWTYEETPEHEFTRHRHRWCRHCNTSSGESGLDAFPSGVVVHRDICVPTDKPGHFRIVRTDTRVAP